METDALIDGLQSRHFPRITRQDHEAGKERVERERAKFIELRFADGTVLPFFNGTISWHDLTAANGYGAWISDYDRFGWPAGHPESPASHPSRDHD